MKNTSETYQRISVFHKNHTEGTITHVHDVNGLIKLHIKSTCKSTQDIE